MKEDWIKKLVELLNEYDWEDLEYWFIDWEIRRKVRNFDNERNTWKQVVWYTKNFWFIQWLVDNDKIEFREDFYLEDQHWWWFGEDENIMMLLSIQDNPIEFLISILK